MRILLFEIAADCVQVFHLLLPLFLFGGIFSTAFGLFGWLTWWMRSFRWRALHVALGLLVFVETLLQIPCPLTTLEKHLRRSAGMDVYAGDFLEHVLDQLFNWWTSSGARIPEAVVLGFKIIAGMTMFVGWTMFPPRLPKPLLRIWPFARPKWDDPAVECPADSIPESSLPSSVGSSARTSGPEVCDA